MARRQPASRNFDELARLAGTGASGLPDATLRASCDLFMLHGAEGRARDDFIELTRTLAPRVSHATLLSAAERLAPWPSTPTEVIEALCAEGGSVAALVLAQAPSLPAELRNRALHAEDPRIAAAFAGRTDLSDDEQAQLVMRGETAVRRILAGGETRLGRSAAAALLDAGRVDDRIAALLLGRSDIDPAATLPLYRFAAPAQRRAIRAALDKRVADRALAAHERPLGSADAAALIDTAIEGVDSLTRAVAELSGRGAPFIAAAVQDDSREILTLALLALGVAPEDGVRMLLRTGAEVARDSRALGELVDILRYGERVTANAILAASWPREGSARPSRTVSQHQPAMAEGGTPSRLPDTTGQRRRPSATVLDELRGQTQRGKAGQDG
jgi:uncharacterized protein (DUF2336 family)